MGRSRRPWEASSPFAALLSMLVASTLTLGAACSQGDTADQITVPVDLGMTSRLPAFYADPTLTMYEVQIPVPLPVRLPTADELKNAGPAPKGTPYPRAPYLTDDDESVELHYTISNLDAEQRAVWMLIDPWNEFVRWSPGVAVVSGEQTVPNWGYDLPFLVPARSRVEGTLSADDMREIAIKLASVENVLDSPQAWAAEAPDASLAARSFDPTGIANHIFMPQNLSSGPDPLFVPWLPPVIAGITGFDLGLRTMDSAANVAVEVTMEIKDLNGNRFVVSGSKDPQLGLPPVRLSPPGARL